MEGGRKGGREGDVGIGMSDVEKVIASHHSVHEH